MFIGHILINIHIGPKKRPTQKRYTFLETLDFLKGAEADSEGSVPSDQ